jgi:copper homeostasis protein (lipoprotein)
MRILDATVTRRSRSGDIIGPAQRVDVITALKAMTIWPAWHKHEDKLKGSIEVGKLADFVVLSADPTAVDPETLDQIDVVETIKEGRTVYAMTDGGESSGGLAGSFVGSLPCADCEGIRYRIDLFDDGAFYQQMTYLGRGDDATFDTIGSWALATGEPTVALFGGDREPERWKVVDRSTLQKLDSEGREIASALNYDLVRIDGLDPLEPRLAMRGTYMYMADAAMFHECLTGRRFPVAMEGASIDLERVYLETPHDPGAEVLVSVDGRLAQRLPMEGEGTVEMLVVEELEGVWPGETCGARMSVSELENTYWKLTRLGEQPVLVEPQQREPHLVLRSGEGRVAGSDGCNRFMGSYTIDGPAIDFGQMATTRMACPEGMEAGVKFTEALGAAVRYRLLVHHLELIDAEGRTVARFEAREMN